MSARQSGSRRDILRRLRDTAYVFDFGDEWRVRLTLRDHAQPDGGTYPRVLERQGTAPPQYPGLDED